MFHCIERLTPPVNSSEYLALEKNKKIAKSISNHEKISRFGEFLIIENLGFISMINKKLK